LVLSEEAVFAYKVDNVYAPQAEACIRWDDKDIAVDWPIDPKEVITSEKDLNAHTLRNAEVFE
jgi:dTDP-4-dehydrorhamnose 3,5-epimerase